MKLSRKPTLMKKSNLASPILQIVNQITESNIHVFRNTNFDNMAVCLLTSGHRQSFELLEKVVLKDKTEYSGNLMNDVESLHALSDYFTKAEDFCRDGRYHQVSQAYCEAAKCPTFETMFWLQELIMEHALEAAKRYKADGGRQLAYCQLQLAQMLEATAVRQQREQNIIYGQNYIVLPPQRVINLLQSCLDSSLGRSQWLSDLIPYEYVCAGHLARVKLASEPNCEENLKSVIKLAEQASCIWLECLSNFYLGRLLASQKGREGEATVRLERGLEVLSNQGQHAGTWSGDETCMQAPSLDRLAGMCTCCLAKLKLRLGQSNSAEKAKSLLENFLQQWPEVSDERADGYILLGEIYDRNFYSPDKAVECYSQAYKIRPNSDSARVAMGIANSHLLLDGVMRLLDSGEGDDGACKRTSKRLLIWKDQPDEFEHDLESD